MAAPVRRILILGGTGEARALAALLVGRGHDVITSLAGRTSAPVLPEGAVRHGGFGGAAGIARYVEDQGIALIADATHPFAAVISANAAAAARQAGIPCLRLERLPWTRGDGDDWRPAASIGEAARMIPEGATAFVTVGRQEAGAFAARGDIAMIARMIEPPDAALPAHCRVILARPPFALEDELALMRGHGVTVLVAKNSGGTAARAKLDAARQLGIPVIMIARPPKPAAETAATVDEMAALIAALRL